ncbi:hypothetical protein PC128_g14315 [Phytophthora cactorum]|nr:hypothetical protein PC120_g10171 [Phytophthora cactorum]KAG3088569.1 hypothetical protein PC121_g4430 [Phytophthora cactorum]KAG3183171.1 hypothetical protein PC128_g14315 [Phytophthora cactorum]KAG4053768.1 hypothetical protein PC123_g11093 [Phytophthora cactorum]
MERSKPRTNWWDSDSHHDERQRVDLQCQLEAVEAEKEKTKLQLKTATEYWREAERNELQREPAAEKEKGPVAAQNCQ